MGGKSKAPPPPDYKGAAEATAEASKENIALQNFANRPDQYNPWAAQTWDSWTEYDPASGQDVTRWSQNVELDPDLQWALDNQIYLQGARSELGGQMMGRAWNEFSDPMDWSGFQHWADAPDVNYMDPMYQHGAVDTWDMQGVQGGQYYYDQAGNAIYDQAASRLDPRFERQKNELETQLVGQGLRVGDAAYDRAMREFEETRNDAYNQAQWQATQGAGAEGQRWQGMDQSLREMQFGERGTLREQENEAMRQMWGAERGQLDNLYNQQMQQAQYMNELRMNQIQEEMQRRGFTLNEINALISGQQVSNPSFQGFSKSALAETPDYMGAMSQGYQAQLQQASAKNAGFGDMMGGMMGMASTFGPMLSDRRLKKNIKRVGSTAAGTPIYSYQYKWGGPTMLGVMADEVPDARVIGPDGYYRVDYSKVK
jgi:hypothetical protein